MLYGFSEEKINIMIALGADVSRTSQSKGMHGAQLAARSYAGHGVVYTQSIQLRHNPDTYISYIGPRITSALQQIDYFVAGIGSGGTFSYRYRTLFKATSRAVCMRSSQRSVSNGGPAHAHDTEGIV